MVLLKEFKTFLIKWNAVDLAIWFIFWGAFATVIRSLVDNVIMPPIGRLLSWVDFADLFIALDWNIYESISALKEAWAPAIRYGAFLNDVISFVILWFIVFLFVRTYNKMKHPEVKAPTGPSELDLLKEIRDALVK